MGPGSLKLSRIAVCSLVFIGGFFIFQNNAQAAAGINKQINFQGKVVNADGTNVTDGSYNFLFCIYTTATPATPCTSGTLNSAIWEESKSLTVTSGVFQTNLGDTTTLPGSVNFNTDSIYLGMNFNSNGQMTPLVQFTASPYAFNAANLEGGTWEAPGAIGSTTANSGAFTALGSTGITNLASTAGSTLTLGNSTGAATLASGGTSAWTNTSGNLSISTTTSGTLALTSVGALNFSAGAASTWTMSSVVNALNIDSNTLSIDALNNRIGIGTSAPSAYLDIKASDSNSASLQINAGSTPSSPSDGDIWYDGTSLYFRNNTTNKNLLASGGADNLGNHIMTQNLQTNGYWISNNGSSNGLYVDSAGNIGIGTNSTGSSLLSLTNNSSNATILANATGGGSLLQLQNNGTNKVTVANNGGMTINGSDSSIVRTTTADFSLGTVGSSLTNSNNYVQLADGTPANSGQGAITTASQPTVNASIGAGAMSITRPDGKYLVINGGGTLTTSLYDPLAATASAFTASQPIVLGSSCTNNVGAGALLLPRSNGMYVLIAGSASCATTGTSNIDPTGTVPTVAGPALATAVTGAGTVAFKRPDGKYLVTIGASTPGSATNIYDPVANTFVAGPAAATGTWSTGALAIPRPDGTALIVNGGSTSTTNIYNPYATSATIGGFSSAGPSLDGNKATGSCGINGSGSVAIKRQDGKFIILSKVGAEAVYDPSANTMTCTTGVSNVFVLGDGAHAIPLQNGKVLILTGGNNTTNTAFVYNQDTDTFSAYSGTAPSATNTGAHSILRTDGTWQIINGGGTTTNNFNTNLPMSDSYPAQLSAAVGAGAGCTVGNHSYYTSFVINGAESGLSNKSVIVSCTSANGTVALSNIPVGPVGTTARKIYRTPAGDGSAPQLLTTISDNTTLIFNDAIADGSLGSAYAASPTPSTWYTSEAISNNYIGIGSTLKWTAQLEAVYSADRNSPTNTSFKVLQFFVRTAINTSTCAASLASAPWQEIQNSGDSIRAVSGANCAQVAVHFNRAMPKKLADDRGTWIGNNSTILRYDYTTPGLFDYIIDNSAVMKKTSFDFSTPDSSAQPVATPLAPGSATPGGSGSCTSGNHFWFETFVINGVESSLSPASTVQSCSGSNQEVLTLQTGPSGTTARKIYRTAAALLVTDTPYYVGTVADNSTTSFTDSLADSALGAPYSQLTSSGPTLSRAESTRVESVNNQLTLPLGRITPTVGTMIGTTGVYTGAFGADHQQLNNYAGMGTFVIARDDKTFLVVEGSNATATADLYDPATQTFTNQTNAGDKPTAATGSGAFAIKRPNGKFLVILGNNTNTTNIYDQYAPPGSRFTPGPSLVGTAANQAAFAILNADGTYTILPGNAAATTSIYDPVRNTMTAGPLQTTGTNMGAFAIPMTGTNSNIYRVAIGTTLAGAVNTATMNYNSNTKTFSAGPALAAGIGSGAFAFQRQDGNWIIIRGDSTGAANTATGLFNPTTGVDGAGLALTNGTDRGGHVIPRADGTFLVISGNLAAGLGVTSTVYNPFGGIVNTTSGVPQGVMIGSGPSLVLPGGAGGAAPTVNTMTTGGAIDAGTHSWKYTFVTNGVESQLSTKSTVQTIVSGTQTQPLTAPAGPTGTTARNIYRTKVGDTGNYFYLGTINDNSASTIYTDAVADSTLTLQYAGGGVGDGGLSFQRPDGKFVTIFGGSVPSKAVNIYDAGWYADGQYLSEEMNVPALAANATLDWQQTPDQYVRMAARVAASQGALADASYAPIANPGGSIGNAGGETWAQVQINFRRDFPTFSGNLNGVYNSSGGMTYIYRPISTPTVNSYQITNGQDLLTLGTNGNNVLRVTSDGNIMSSATGGFYTGGADLAENYTSNDALQKGEIVSVDATDSHNVKRSSSAYESDVLGVVSTAPGFVAGTYTDQSYPIALVGRVPVNVSTQNGMIQAGDRITAASTPGYGMRATVAGRVIGTALESMDLSTMTDCPATNGISSEYKCGQINVFVNLADYQGMPVETLMSEADSSSLTVDDNNSLGTIDPASPLAQYSSQEKVLAFLQNLKDTQTSYSASDILAGNVNAINQIVSPLIVTDTLVAKNIKAENIEGLQFIQTDIQNTQDGIATATTEVKSLGQQVADLQNTVKVLTDDGGITLDGPAQFNGPAVFKAMAEFFDKVVFHKDVAFEGQITFNADTAGYAIVKEGNDNVVVNFSREYATPPVVNASISLQQESNDEVRKATEELLLITNANFIITNVTTKGFEIKIASKTLSDIPFSWTAIAVKDAKTFDAAEKGYAGADGSPAVSAAATDTVETPDTNAGADESPAAAADATVSDTATTPVAGNDTATAVSISSETSPGVAADASSTAVTN